ncbi:hypothetical protein J2Z83_000453 [Virgibacillus natechei]|uniref:Uncharacterized protein n=1 Tax=Virgibacillus natechei TaxID=1216297 RepID=A0ABS4IDE6_9BACI|nr:hypothetical protein [Virgibacillus natechei]MBP1968361.1 hypothetical protein [Virgibacillus natechei]UZD13492.1 hypothetical protein OLD84_02730 [Virgibacillus natechei]
MTYRYKDFYQRINKQSQELLHGGTDYRKTTVSLSLLVADQLKTVTPFLDLLNTKRVVEEHLPDENKERVNDVAKMLYVNARALEVSSKRTAATKAYVAEKTQNQQPIKLVKAKK